MRLRSSPSKPPVIPCADKLPLWGQGRRRRTRRRQNQNGPTCSGQRRSTQCQHDHQPTQPVRRSHCGHLGTTTLLHQGRRPCRPGRESDRQGSNRIEPTYPLHHRIRSGAPMVDPLLPPTDSSTACCGQLFGPITSRTRDVHRISLRADGRYRGWLHRPVRFPPALRTCAFLPSSVCKQTSSRTLASKFCGHPSYGSWRLRPRWAPPASIRFSQRSQTWQALYTHRSRRLASPGVRTPWIPLGTRPARPAR